MPKTKLGNETKDNGAKKAKVDTIKCEMSPRLDEEGLKFFQQAVKEKTDTSEKDGVRIFKTPFTCTVIDKLVEGDEFLGSFRSELEELDFVEQNNDLFKFRQSGELSKSEMPFVSNFREMLLHQLRPWIQKATGIALEESVDLFLCKVQSRGHVVVPRR